MQQIRLATLAISYNTSRSVHREACDVCASIARVVVGKSWASCTRCVKARWFCQA